MKNLMDCRKERAYDLATRINRLAYLLDPYEYFDVVGRDQDSFKAHVAQIARNILSGFSYHYFDWLNWLIECDDTDDRDRERAMHIRFGLIDWIAEESLI